MRLMVAFFRRCGCRRFLCVTVLASTAFAERVDLLRDDFWVAHIFASTPAGAAFASGYAQAEDRLEELMRNYRKAEGTMPKPSDRNGTGMTCSSACGPIGASPRNTIRTSARSRARSSKRIARA